MSTTHVGRNINSIVSMVFVLLWVFILAVTRTTTDPDGKTAIALALLPVSAIAVVFGLIGGTGRVHHGGRTLGFVCTGIGLFGFIVSLGMVIKYLG